MNVFGRLWHLPLAKSLTSNLDISLANSLTAELLKSEVLVLFSSTISFGNKSDVYTSHSTKRGNATLIRDIVNT